MQNEKLLNDIATHVEDLYHTHFLPFLKYHNLVHTRLIVQHATEITAFYNLEKETQFIIQVAAWFHDTGHLIGPMAIHEENSVLLMQEFMSNQGAKQEISNKIAACIMATKMPVHPSNLPEAILCDADTYHLGTGDFIKIDKLVWEEMEMRTNKIITSKKY